MVPVRYPAFCLGLLVLLGGCSSDLGQTRPSPTVRADYTAVWLDREAQYRQDIALAAPSDPQQVSSRERERGALAVLEAFREYRKIEPVDRAAVSWLRSRHAAHRARLLDTGLEIDRLVELVADPGKLDSVVLVPDKLKSLAFNVGSVNEVRRIYRELRRASGDAGQGAVSEKPPTAGADFDVLSHGLVTGFGAMFGR